MILNIVAFTDDNPDRCYKTYFSETVKFLKLGILRKLDIN